MHLFSNVIIILTLNSMALCLKVINEEKAIFKISVFYDDSYQNMEEITMYSAEIVNGLYKTGLFQFEYTLNKVHSNNSYKLTKLLCSELNDNRIAVIAIGDCPVFVHLNGIATSLRIPYIAIKWETSSGPDTDESGTRNGKFSDDEPINKLNIHPPAHKLLQAITDLIEYYKWEYITILYQESSDLSRIENLIRLPRKNFESIKFRVRVKQLGENSSEWIYLLKDVKKSGSSHIIVDIQTRHMNQFLKVAEEIGLMTAYFHFMFTSLDLAVLEYSPSANITALQVFEPDDVNVASILAEFNLFKLKAKKELFKYMPSEAAFVYDAFLLLASTIHKNNLAKLIQYSMNTPASCDTESPWMYGNELMSRLRTNTFHGLSGYIEFEPHTGLRANLTMSIVDRSKYSVDLIGFWRDQPINNRSIEIVRSFAKERDTINSRLNRRLIVTTKLEAPYVMIRDTNTTLYGNIKYKGYCVELLERIANICNFTYNIKLVDDGLHGNIINGKWNGIVSELIDKKADLAVAALTISYQREQVIDFTKPFLNLGISILYKRPLKKTPNLFSFMSPLSVEIWLYMLAAYIVVSIMLFVLARFSPYEWRASHPCDPFTTSKVNPFTAFNSFWFTIGSLMQQGIDFNPRACSTRILVGAWWFFALILISSYTANLAAFLTTKRLTSPIEDVEALSKQNEIKYGCLNGGSTQQFFQESKIQTYEKMWNFMNNNPEVFVQSTEEGIDRIKKGGYAYLVESITNEYMRQRDCELIQVGGILDTKGYGIGTPNGSPWRDQISNAILQLQENGELQEMYTKWWETEAIPTKCDNSEDKKKDSASELSLASVGGVFVVLAAGLSLSFLVAFIESLWAVRKLTTDSQSFREAICKDFHFALCQKSSRKRSRSSTLNRSDSGEENAAVNSNRILPSRSSSSIENEIYKLNPFDLALNDMIDNQNINNINTQQRRKVMSLNRNSVSLDHDNGYMASDSFVTSDEKTNFNTSFSTKRQRKRYYYHI